MKRTRLAYRSLSSVILTVCLLSVSCDLFAPGKINDALSSSGTGPTWVRIADQPFGRENGLQYTTSGGKAYIGLGDTLPFTGGSGSGKSKFASFDPATLAWSTLSTGPYSTQCTGLLPFGTKLLSFASDSAGNWHTGSIISYDTSGGTWTSSAVSPSTMPVPWRNAFSIGSVGYALDQDWYMWSYDGSNWTKKARSTQPSRWGAVEVTIGTKAYILSGDDSNQANNSIAECYDTGSDTWTILASIPMGLDEKAYGGFALGSKIYFLTQRDLPTPIIGSVGAIGNLKVYDTIANTWAHLANYDIKSYLYGAFAINGTGYIVTTEGTYRFIP